METVQIGLWAVKDMSGHRHENHVYLANLCRQYRQRAPMIRLSRGKYNKAHWFDQKSVEGLSDDDVPFEVRY